MMFWCQYVWVLAVSVWRHGINFYSVLDAWARWQPNKTAWVVDECMFSYRDIQQYSQYLCHVWQDVPLPKRVGLLLEQDVASMAALFALSRLGKHVVIVNAHLTTPKMTALLQQHNLYLIGHAKLLPTLPIESHSFTHIPSMRNCPDSVLFRWPKQHLNTISVCSSGSTGTPKLTSRKSKPWLVWPLLDTLLRRLQFLRLQSLFVMTPICHAAGLSAALMAFAFGKKVVLQSRLHIDKAFALIDQHQIDTLNAVPTILYRLLNHKIGEDQSINNMVSVKRLVCGSAPLSANLYRDFHAMFPHIGIYNVYGSSETGMNILATPNDLAKHPDSAGRVIKGVKIKILGQNGQTLGINETGVLWSRCAWSAHAMQWLQSGDLAYQDDNGYVYLKGRVDDMLICGGVNVYPVDLENIVLTHPDIIQAKAYAVVDGEYGQCMSVQVVLHQRAQSLDSEGIALWLSDKAPRYLRPASIMIVQDLATDNIGKVIVH